MAFNQAEMDGSAPDASKWATRAELATRALRYGLHAAVEHFRPPRVAWPDDVPRSHDDLNGEYLTRVLCAHTPGAKVLAFDIGAPNEGTTSRRGLTVHYNDEGKAAGLPTALFAKSSPKWLSRLMVGLLGALDSETTFYNFIRPQLDIEAPYGYHAVFDRSSARSMILLEDISRTRGAVFCNPAHFEIDRPLAETMIAQMATYHGTFWESDRLQAPKLHWMPSSLGWQQRGNAGVNFRSRSLVGLKRAADYVPSQLLDRRNEIYPAFMRSLEINITGPQTLLHSDVHLGNWFMTSERIMGQYDWQAIVRGGWALDVAYALTSALPVDDRRAWERDLLELYIDRLAAAGAPTLNFADAFLAYRQQMFHALVFWLYTLGAGSLQPDMQPRDACDANVSRMAQATIDLESLDSL